MRKVAESDVFRTVRKLDAQFSKTQDSASLKIEKNYDPLRAKTFEREHKSDSQLKFKDINTIEKKVKKPLRSSRGSPQKF